MVVSINATDHRKYGSSTVAGHAGMRPTCMTARFWTTVAGSNPDRSLTTMNLQRLGLCCAALLLAIGLAVPFAAIAQSFDALQGKHYRLQVRSRLAPIALNRLHAWELELRDRDGAPVPDATITVDGGMPAHDHGLPTAPRVTEILGPGRYLLEGMRFQMGGEWALHFRIVAAPGAETLTLEFAL